MHFETIPKMLDKKTTQKELMKVKGITRQRAKLIKASSRSWVDDA